MDIPFTNLSADFVIIIIKGCLFLEEERVGVSREYLKLKAPHPPAKNTMWGWGREK